MNKKEFIHYCKEINIEISDKVYDDLLNYYKLLIEWNSKFNMTSILEQSQVFLLHFYDSLCLSKYINLNRECTLCDFGTGAGFPGMVIALLFKNVKVTLIESNQKKCQFLKHIKETFYLKNVTIICSRIEEYGIKNREIFDIVTCRAVTSIPIIIELATSILKVGGVLAPLKSNCLDELNDASLYKEFHLKLVDVYKYNLPIQNSKRTIPVFKKTDVTDKKYPRNYSSIVKKYKK